MKEYLKNKDSLLENLYKEINETNDLDTKWDFCNKVICSSCSEKYTRIAVKYLEDLIDEDYDVINSKYKLSILLDTLSDGKDPRIIKLYKEILNDASSEEDCFKSIVCYKLGLYYSGSTNNKDDIDYKQAYEYFLEGTKYTKMLENYIGLGDCYFSGWYVNKSLKKAFDLYNKAYEMSIKYPNVVTNNEYSRAIALGKIGRCHLYGIGTHPDVNKALDYLIDALDYYNFGEDDDKGNLIKEDLRRAKELKKDYE